MAHTEEERKALGKRLASARALAGYTIESAARELTARGHPIKKAGLGHWETGIRLPDALWLKRLAKLYNQTLDALVWDEAVSMEAMRVAVEFDHLSDEKQRTFRAVWLAFVQQGAPGGEALPAAPSPPPLPPGTELGPAAKRTPVKRRN